MIFEYYESLYRQNNCIALRIKKKCRMRLNKRTRMGFKNYISPAHLLFIIHFDITRNSPFNMKTNQRQMQNKSNGLLLNIFVFVAKKEEDFDTCTSFPFNPPRPTLFWLQKTPNGNNEITIK